MQIVIGAGEVGRAVYEVLSAKHHCELWDVNPNDGEHEHVKDSSTHDGVKVQCLHVCFPWHDDFLDSVVGWQQHMECNAVVVHSTVPVGTTAQIPNAVHSPIRGVHPNLAEGVRTFVKYFAGLADIGIDAFRACGVPCRYLGEDSRITEAGKLWSTTQYGAAIMVQKAIYDYCLRLGLPFSMVYEQFNYSYNEGYSKLEMFNVRRPTIGHMPGPIGGHCVIPNAKLLDDDIGAWIIERNERLKEGE